MSENNSLLGQVFDEYRLEKPLGAGGMASIYRALDVQLKRYVAIKVIASNFRASAQYKERFEREAQSIARLQHPHIVSIYRFGESQGVYYIAMQFVEGADLAHIIRDYRSNGEVMPIGDVLRVIQGITSALDYVHTRGVIHRDVKPSNIMVNQQGHAFLADFGLALLDDVGTRGEALGSPHYVAPEQITSSGNVVPQSDLYALGITLFEMLTGELPFTGTNPLDITMLHLSEPAPPPSQFNATIPPSIDQVVLRALEKDPYDRFQTGAEFVTALQEAIANWKVEQTPQPGPVRRPSLVLLPQKVHNLNTVVEPSAAPVAPASSVSQRASHSQSIASPTETVNALRPKQRQSWRGAVLFSVLIFVVGLTLLLLLAARGNSGNVSITATDESAVQMPTSAVGVVATTTSNLISVTPQSPEIAALASPTSSLPTVTSELVPSSTAVQQVVVVGSPVLPPTTVPMTLIPSSIPTITQFIPTSTIAEPVMTATLFVQPTAVIVPSVVPTATQQPVQSAAASPAYQLMISIRGEDSLFVVNSGSVGIPLAPLQIVGDRGGVDGSEWGISVLQPGQCVTVWKDSGNPRAPEVNCQQVGTQVTRRGRERFWRSEVDVYYADVRIQQCEDSSCSFSFSP